MYPTRRDAFHRVVICITNSSLDNQDKHGMELAVDGLSSNPFWLRPLLVEYCKQFKEINYGIASMCNLREGWYR
jgi:hypothetical protein